MNPLRIAIADDHEVVRAGLRALIDTESDMVMVGEAATGPEAIELAKAIRPDIMVMDISMPILDGADATVVLRESCPDVRVLVLTIHEDRAHLARLLEAGAAGYVLKRAAAEELVRALRVVADGGTWVDPILAGSVLRSSSAPRPQPRTQHPLPLSEREEEVLRRIAWGETNKQISCELGISTKTVETYKARITEKLGLRTRTEMVRYALQRGWLSDS